MCFYFFLVYNAFFFFLFSLFPRVCCVLALVLGVPLGGAARLRLAARKPLVLEDYYFIALGYC